MKVIYTLTCLLILPLYSAFGQIDWVTQSEEKPGATSSRGTAISEDIAIGSGGGVYIAGTFKGQSKFDQVQFNEDGFNSMFMAKYLQNGNLDWAVKIQGNSNNRCHAVATDDFQHVYIAGEYKQTNALTILNFGNITLEGNGSPSTFLAKADADGNFIWAKSILATPPPGQGHQALVNDIQLDSHGNIYVLGGMVDSVQIENAWYNTAEPGKALMFIAKFLPDGSLAWFKNSNVLEGSGPGFILPGHMSIGSKGQLYVNGTFATFPVLGDVLGWNGDSLDTGIGDGQFLARFDSTGNLEWWESMDSGGHQFPHELGVDAQDNVYLTMQRNGFFEFSSGAANTNDFKGRVMFMKYNAQGQRQFIKDFAHGNISTSSDVWNGSATIHTRPNGTTFMTGLYGSISSSYIVFGTNDTFPMPNPSNDGTRQFLAVFDSDGNYQDVGFVVDDYPSAPSFFWENTAMVSDAEGKLYMTGKFAGHLGVDGDSLVTPGVGSASGQAFTIKFDPDAFLDLSNVSIKDRIHLNQQLHLYPNPASNSVMLEVPDMPNILQAQVRLFSIQGQLVVEKNFRGNSHLLDISGVQEGLYFCQIKIGNQTLTKRLQIRRK